MGCKLMFNSNSTGGGTVSPTAALTDTSLWTYLDGNDITSDTTWADRKGHNNFTSTLALEGNSYYQLNATKVFSKTRVMTCSSFELTSLPFTLEFCLKADSTAIYGILFANTTFTDFKICNRNNDYFGMYAVNCTPNSVDCVLTSEVFTSTMHILTYVFTGSQLLVYMDGVLKSTNSFSVPSSLLSATNYQLGCLKSDTANIITGELYSFRYYKAALTEYEIRCNCLYEASMNRVSTNSEEQMSSLWL